MKELLEHALFEIKALRREIELLRAKQEMIDLFACVLHTSPARRGEGMSSPDIAWSLQKRIDELGKQP